ncbi:MAG: extensin family protein [Pseudomonadota bacterium]
MHMRFLFLFLAAALMATPSVFRPGDVPPAWRPWGPVDLTTTPTWVMSWKLRELAGNEPACLAAMAFAGARLRDLPDRPTLNGCGIPGRVRLTGLAGAGLSPVETRCEIAARLYLWERNTLQPAAQRYLGASVARLDHYSSYSCRPIRTSRGNGRRMSQHATANAIDISGFVLSDGRRITLLRDWDGSGPEAAFLRASRDGLCDWFNMVLSPDYNGLHADHFHADMGFWRGCR